MNIGSNSRPLRAFTLIELLCVIAIIGILMALLLPSLRMGKDQVKQTVCSEQLRQVGLAFHAFGHDHNGLLPMQVLTNLGGTAEWSSSRTSRVFYSSYYHFQALEKELNTAKILACPSDTRTPVARFADLNNDHLSYFVGMNASLARPRTILAGDRNVTNDWDPPATLQNIGAQTRVRWSGEVHRYKGNLLFADGHVDRSRSKWVVDASQSDVITVVALPSVAVGYRATPVLTKLPSGGTPNRGQPTDAQSGAAPQIWQGGPPSPDTGRAPQEQIPMTTTKRASEQSVGTVAVSSPAKAPVKASGQTNVLIQPQVATAPVGVPAPESEDWWGGFGQMLKKLLWLFYLLLFALLAGFAALWKRAKKKADGA